MCIRDSIKAISPCVKSASAKLFLDLHTVLAPSGEERTLNAAAQVMGSLIVLVKRPSRLWFVPCGRAASRCSRGRLEATAAVPAGAGSIWTTKRLLRVWSAPPVGHLHHVGASRSSSGMLRGDIT